MCVGEEGGCGREEVVVFIEAKNSWGSRSPSDLSAMEYGMFDSFFFLLVDLLLPISTIFFLSHHEIWTMMSAFVGLVILCKALRGRGRRSSNGGSSE
jgi:hypothetical protein